MYELEMHYDATKQFGNFTKSITSQHTYIELWKQLGLCSWMLSYYIIFKDIFELYIVGNDWTAYYMYISKVSYHFLVWVYRGS